MPDGSSGTRDPNKSIAKRRRRPSIGLMALEPRLMYDGAAAAAATTAAATQPHTDAGASASGSAASSAPSAPSSAAPATDHAADHPATPPSSPTDNSNTGTPADSSSGGGSPAASATTSSTTGHQIVFIDGNVPDAQALAQGVQPGIEVVILDPNGNGVQQIADYLTSHNEQNLDAIQIVSHGEDATVRLGNTIFGLADISMFSSQLATIGQALKPGGDILFYGCNVGEGVAGALFEIEVSQATGGAHVAASSGLVGAAALGGSWNLDVADGTIDVGNPFTAATLAQYDNVLTNQIWFTEFNTGNTVSDQVGTFAATGTNQTGSSTSIFNASGSTYAFQGIALDAADGVYFAVNSGAHGVPQTIVRGSISGGTPTVMYTATKNSDFIWDVAYSATTGKVYFSETDGNNSVGTSTDTGIYAISSTATGLAQASVTKLISPTAGASDLVSPYGLAIDAADNLLFFNDFSNFSLSGGTHSTTARLEVANLSTGAILSDNLQTINTGSSAALFWGLAIDAPNNKLYWTVNDTAVAANNKILTATYTTGATPTLGTVTTLYQDSSLAFIPTNLTLDTANNQYYGILGSTGSTASGEVVVGSLTSPNNSPTVVFTVPGPVPSQPKFVELEAAPVLSVTGASPTVITGSGASLLASGATVTELDQNIASATISIGTGFQTGKDTLSFNSGSSSKSFADGHTINASFNSSTGVLTLSGVASATDYQTALATVAFASTATISASRSFTWSTTDGHLASNSASTSATVHVAPTVTPGAGGTYNGGGPAVKIAPSLTLTPATGTLATATISIDSTHFLSGDTLSFTNTSSTSEGNIAVQSYNSSTGVLTLFSNGNSATMSQWTVALNAVTYSFTTSNVDPTIKNGSADTSRTLSYTVNDGTVSSTAATNTLTLVHTAPVVTASGTVNFTGGGSPVTLDSGLTLTNNGSNSLIGATVAISTGFQTGVDVLSVNLPQTGGTITGTSISVSYSGGALTLSGSDSFANYLNALNHVQYSVAAGTDPTHGGQTGRTISWSVKDNNASNNTSNTGTSSLTTVHTAPTLSISGSPAYSAGGSPVVLLSSATLADVDSGGFLSGAVVSITSGFLSGDTLNFAAQNGITIQSNVNGALTLTGSSSIANYAAALQSITFSSSAGDPTNGGADTSRTISWQVTDGSTSNGSSNTGFVTLGVSAPPPSITGAGGTVSYFAGGSAVTLDGALGITDAASTTLSSATVSITGHFLLGDTLTVDTTGTNITALYSPVHGVLQLSGSDTLAHYQTVLERITYSSTARDPDAGGSANTRTISWQVNDGRSSNNLSTAVTTTVDVTHVATTIGAGGSVSFTPGNGPLLVDPTVTVTDATADPITSITVKITAGLTTGDMLAFNGGANSEVFVDGSTITGSYNAATGTLTLTAGSGSPTAADFQLAAQSITFNNSSVTASSPGSTRTLSWTVFTANPNETSVTTTSTVVPTTPPSDPSTIGNASSFAPGTSPPVTSGLSFSPGGTSGTGTFVSGTSGIVTLGYGTSGYGTSGPGTFGFNAFTPGAFDPTIFGSGAGGPGYFDPGGGFGSGLDFSTDFTTASNDVPADSEAPITLVADGWLGIGFDRKTDKGIGDGVPGASDDAVVVADKDSGDTGHGPLQLAVGNDRALGPDAVRAVERLVPADAVPVVPAAGKLALSAQLRAAGRHGLLHDRLALLKSLRDGVRG